MNLPEVLHQHVFGRLDILRKGVWRQFLQRWHLFPVEFGRLLGVICRYFVIVFGILGCYIDDSSEEHAP